MSSISSEILIVLLLIVANGVFSGSEIAVVSARKVRLEQLVDRGNRKARVALKLANAPNNFLATVQIGITLIGILSGAVGGATLAQRLRPVFEGIPALQPYSEGVSVAIVVSLITYLSPLEFDCAQFREHDLLQLSYVFAGANTVDRAFLPVAPARQ